MNGYNSQAEYWHDLIRWGRMVTDDKIKAAAYFDEMENRASKSLQSGLFLPLAYTCIVFSLNRFERHCLYLALLPELDIGFEAAFAELHGEADRRLLSAELALRLYVADDEETFPLSSCFGTGGMLRDYLLTFSGGIGRSDLAVSWKLAKRIKEFVVENRLSNPALAGFTFLWEPDADLDASGDVFQQKAELERMERFLTSEVEQGAGAAAILVCGPVGSGKKSLITSFARRLNQAVLFVKTSAIAPENCLDSGLLHEIFRESVLRQSVICFDDLDKLNFLTQMGFTSQEEAEINAVSAILERASEVSNLVFATSRKPYRVFGGGFSGRLLTVDLPVPDEEQRRLLWRQLSSAYKISSRISLEEFAGKFIFTPGQIQSALLEGEKLADVQGSSEIDTASLYQGCYSQIEHELEGTKAVRIPGIFRWDDLILPPQSKDLLRLACEQVRHRYTVYNKWGFGAKLPYGRGLSLLFSGPPGTGKTMGAQVVASELKMELFKVNLAGVVSKYIGETEKNLQEVFREAKKSQGVLFFDEADVLFSKRMEVKETNDKYSNMEAAFMLQKIEEYEGVCVLATNYMQNIDEAFKRRIKFVVEFPFPNEEYRTELWRAVFPSGAPLGDDLDLEFLAGRFELSGSSIKNIALNASFMAAAQGKAVTMKEILIALRIEMAKNGKIVSKEELGQYFMLV